MIKTIEHHATLYDVIEGFKEEVDALKEEMEGWRDSLSDNNMEHLPKFDEVSECCDELENVEADSIEIPDGLIASISWVTSAAKQRTSRASRAGYAANELEAAMNFLSELFDGREEVKQEYDDFINDLSTKTEALRAISFPGMY